MNVFLIVFRYVIVVFSRFGDLGLSKFYTNIQFLYHKECTQCILLISMCRHNHREYINILYYKMQKRFYYVLSFSNYWASGS